MMSSAAYSVSKLTTRGGKFRATRPARRSCATAASMRARSPSSCICANILRASARDLGREMRDRRRHVLAQPARTQEPCRAAVDEVDWSRSASPTAPRRPPCCRALRSPSTESTNPKTSRLSRYARTISGGFAPVDSSKPMHERAADAVDHAVGDVRRDDLALQRMALHVRRVTLAQRRRKIALQRGRDPRIVGQRRREQLVVQPDLAVREQYRLFRDW